jgi:hypothetical protein
MEVVALLSGIIVRGVVIEGTVGREGLVLVLVLLPLSVLLLEMVLTNLFLGCQDLVADLVDVVERELKGREGGARASEGFLDKDMEWNDWSLGGACRSHRTGPNGFDNQCCSVYFSQGRSKHTQTQK